MCMYLYNYSLVLHVTEKSGVLLTHGLLKQTLVARKVWIRGIVDSSFGGWIMVDSSLQL